MSLWRVVLKWSAAAVLALLLAFGVAWQTGMLPGALAARKLVVRGCMLTNAYDLTAQLGCDGSQSVPQLWVRAGSIEAGKWLEEVRVRGGWRRQIVLNVEERCPLLLLIGGDKAYWLCDDGTLVERENEAGETFAAILRLPRVALPDDPGPGPLANAADLLTIAAACEYSLPSQIAKIALDRRGDITLYEPDGFRIRLGQPRRLPERIAALPKVLRVCAANKEQLLYLDATDWEGMVFYQKWKGPVAHLLGSE